MKKAANKIVTLSAGTSAPLEALMQAILEMDLSLRRPAVQAPGCPVIQFCTLKSCICKIYA